MVLRHQGRQQRPHLRNSDTEIDVNIVECVYGHAGIRGISRVLHHRHTAAPFDGHEAGRAVVEHARQYDPNHARAMRHGRRAKERIDCRSVSIFAGPLSYQHLVFLNQEMIVRRSDIDASWLKTLAIFGQLRLKGLMAVQPPQQRFPGIVSRHVLDDEDGCRQVGRQLANKLVERFQSACRRAENNYVSTLRRHIASLPFSRQIQMRMSHHRMMNDVRSSG
jgi:hypothetical protein